MALVRVDRPAEHVAVVTLDRPERLTALSIDLALEPAEAVEDRNQLMLGFTENLPEAMPAFDAGRPPVYTDEPRRALFT